MASRIKTEMKELVRESVLGLDPEARGRDQPGSELSRPAVMGAQESRVLIWIVCLLLSPRMAEMM